MILTSSDGLIWTSQNSGTSVNIRRLTHNQNNIFLQKDYVKHYENMHTLAYSIHAFQHLNEETKVYSQFISAPTKIPLIALFPFKTGAYGDKGKVRIY